jgi:hypothetical protein
MGTRHATFIADEIDTVPELRALRLCPLAPTSSVVRVVRVVRGSGVGPGKVKTRAGTGVDRQLRVHDFKFRGAGTFKFFKPRLNVLEKVVIKQVTTVYPRDLENLA